MIVPSFEPALHSESVNLSASLLSGLRLRDLSSRNLSVAWLLPGATIGCSLRKLTMVMVKVWQPTMYPREINARLNVGSGAAFSCELMTRREREVGGFKIRISQGHESSIFLATLVFALIPYQG